LDVGELGEHPVLALRNPLRGHRACLRRCVWAHQASNLEPKDYESSALTVELYAPSSRIMEDSKRPAPGAASVWCDCAVGAAFAHWLAERASSPAPACTVARLRMHSGNVSSSGSLSGRM